MPSPDRQIITDDYELEQGKAVDFFWMTRQPVEVTGQTIVLRGQAGRVIRVEDLPFFNCTHRRIAIRKPGRVVPF